MLLIWKYGSSYLSRDRFANSISKIISFETISKISNKNLLLLLHLLLDLNWPWLKQNFASLKLHFDYTGQPGLQLCQNQGCSIRGHKLERCEVTAHILPFWQNQSQRSSVPFYFLRRQLLLLVFDGISWVDQDNFCFLFFSWKHIQNIQWI